MVYGCCSTFVWLLVTFVVGCLVVAHTFTLHVFGYVAFTLRSFCGSVLRFARALFTRARLPGCVYTRWLVELPLPVAPVPVPQLPSSSLLPQLLQNTPVAFQLSCRCCCPLPQLRVQVAQFYLRVAHVAPLPVRYPVPTRLARVQFSCPGFVCRAHVAFAFDVAFVLDVLFIVWLVTRLVVVGCICCRRSLLVGYVTRLVTFWLVTLRLR